MFESSLSQYLIGRSVPEARLCWTCNTRTLENNSPWNRNCKRYWTNNTQLAQYLQYHFYKEGKLRYIIYLHTGWCYSSLPKWWSRSLMICTNLFLGNAAFCNTHTSLSRPDLHTSYLPPSLHPPPAPYYELSLIKDSLLRTLTLTVLFVLTSYMERL